MLYYFITYKYLQRVTRRKPPLGSRRTFHGAVVLRVGKESLGSFRCLHRLPLSF